MSAELLTSFCRFALRLLPLTCMLLAPALGLAQSAVKSCEPSPAVKEELRKISKVDDDPDLPYRVRRDRQIAMSRELLKKYGNDFHVQRRYQDTRMGGFFSDRDALVEEYRAQMEKNPNDPLTVYLYARLLVGRQTKQAIELLQKLAQNSPEFPWTHLKLNEIYNSSNFRDGTKSKEHLKLWIAKCPTALNALSSVSRSGDKEIIAATAQSLRARLTSSTDIDDLYYWSELWSLEFKLKPVTEHAELRKQIAEDLKRIRAAYQTSKEQLQALQAGYKQIGDKPAQTAVEDEILRLYPRSEVSRRMVQSRYYDTHKYPKNEEPEAKKQEYQRGLLQAASEWVKQWPNDELAWSARVRAMTQLEGVSDAELEAAYNGYAKAHEQGGSYSIPPLETSLAGFYLKRGVHLERVPTLLQKGLTEIEQIEKNTGGSDLYTRDDPEDTNLRYVRMNSWPLMAEAYARLKQPDKAQAVLAQIANAIKPKTTRDKLTEAQKRTFDYNQTVYWQAVGKVAEGGQRKLDALAAYQTALSFRRSGPGSGAKDELSDNAQRLWKELGGTDQGWQAYLARNDDSKRKAESAELATWDSKNTELATFDLTDLAGRKWSPADLKGKVAFINFWATWCGPCRNELPYVQKLREQVKDKKDVMVLTLNIDEELGMVEPFMKENKYDFPVLLAQAYAESQGVNSIPRNWVISFDGKIMFEGIGFGNDGADWMKRVTQMIEKVKETK
jgi:thiol-disulfide isomerase/thioredoxin